MFTPWQLLYHKFLKMKYSRTRRRPIRKHRTCLALEGLEDRFVPSTIMVTNGHDTGAGSLREAIAYSNAHPGVGGPNLIAFNLGSTFGVPNYQITPDAALPAITSPVVIDGTTNTASPLVYLTNNGPAHADGLTIDASGCTIRGLQIGGYLDDAILVNSNNNIIEDVGIGAFGTAHANGAGIVIAGGDDNTIGGTTAADADTISENLGSGIAIDNGQGNKIEGDFIGTISFGPYQGNGLDGVKIEGANAKNNIVGGPAAADANVISGNTDNGVEIITSANNNYIENNLIGTMPNGMIDQGNFGDGVYIGSDANNNFIGVLTATIEGKQTGVGNVISGNGSFGVEITGFGTDLNTLVCNVIGTDTAGDHSIPNYRGGVLIHGGASDNLVGTVVAASHNLISGNFYDGITISGVNTTDNLVESDFIGTNLNDTGNLPNGRYGVFIEAGATGNYIGAPGSHNVISGNTHNAGVDIEDDGTSGNMVEGNLIGVNGADNAAQANLIGVTIARGATDNAIGGSMTGAGNVISYNTEQGVYITGSATTGNMIEGNLIGTDKTGMLAQGNGYSGVAIVNGAYGNFVGGPNQADSNTISANKSNGVIISGAGTDTNTVELDLIGTNSLGTGALGNDHQGVLILDGAANNTVGGGNVISGNTDDGVQLIGKGTTGNQVVDNLIGLNINGTGTLGAGSLGNGFNGVLINGGASANGVVDNFISGNVSVGIRIADAGTDSNGVQGNFIGLEQDEVTPLPNLYGVFIEGGSTDNILGGPNPGDGNTIAFNTHAGVGITGNKSVGNTITENSIFANGGLGIDLGNTGMPLPNNNGTHTGPNDLLNYPVLTSVTASGNMDVVSGTYNGAANSFFTVEIFDNPSGDQGEHYLGNVTVSTNASGNAKFTYSFAPSAANPILTATATDALVNTSEFSAPLPIYAMTGTAETVPYTAGVASLNAVLAYFTDTNPSANANQYTVTINWGDAAAHAPPDTSAGNAVVAGSGFDVLGSHAYATAGDYSIVVTIMGLNGESVTINSTAVVELGA